MKTRTDLDLRHEDLLAALDYDPATGIFIGRVRTGRRVPGKVAGHVKTDGYRAITVAQRYYAAHRLAWFYHYKEWPNGELDHINGNPDDNRIDNLRVATRSQQVMNSKGRADRRSRFRNVHVRGHRYVAYANIAGKRIHLGCFKSEDEAGAAAAQAIAANYGQFARMD